MLHQKQGQYPIILLFFFCYSSKYNPFSFFSIPVVGRIIYRQPCRQNKRKLDQFQANTFSNSLGGKNRKEGREKIAYRCLLISETRNGSLQVFEDQSNGIICYRDDKGEVICEAYDEGPRFQQQIPRAACHPR